MRRCRFMIAAQCTFSTDTESQLEKSYKRLFAFFSISTIFHVFFFSAFLYFTYLFISWLLQRSPCQLTHKESLFELRESENTFKDSGYYDFFILTLYDLIFRLYFIYSLVVSSEYSISEKASWLVPSGVLDESWNALFSSLVSINQLFYFLIVLVPILSAFNNINNAHKGRVS